MSLAGGDLTTLAAVKGYIDSAPPDTVLSGLVIRVSRLMLSCLNRPLLVPRAYTEQFDGTGTRQLMLPNWPLLSLISLTISGTVVPISPQATPGAFGVPFGYRFQPWNGMPPGDPAAVQLVGTRFHHGNQNVVVQYTAGYQVTGEVPTVASYTPLVPWGSWATDQGVTYKTSGVALTAIPSGSPSVGQYVPPSPGAASPVYTYTFNAADVTAGLLINYGYIPADIEQAAIEFISERASYRRRVGIRSQSLAGQEVMSYNLAGISDFVKTTLADYISVIPPATGVAV
jgi:hypothetical protein